MNKKLENYTQKELDAFTSVNDGLYCRFNNLIDLLIHVQDKQEQGWVLETVNSWINKNGDKVYDATLSHLEDNSCQEVRRPLVNLNTTKP